MNNFKVILVQPPVKDFYLTAKRTLPYGLAAIATCLRQSEFDVEIIDALATPKSRPIAWPAEFSYLEPFYGKPDISSFSLFHRFRHFGYSFEHIATQIRNKKPAVVGISSLFTAYCDAAELTAVMIKKFWPDCWIVMGGHHPTHFPESVLSCSAVDFVLRGEAETSLPKLCQSLKTGRNFDTIPGIAFRRDTTIFTREPAWEKDLSALPLPAADLIQSGYYRRKNRTAAMVVSSRGCPMRCSYCSMSAASSHARFRQRRVDDVLKEIQVLAADPQLGFIDFEDENLCLNKTWFLDLFSGIRDLLKGRNVELRAMNGLFPPAIDEKIVCMMADAGFKTLNLSLGSTCAAQLKRFQRPDVRNAFDRALSLAQTHGLDCVSYIIAAAPGQSAETSLEDLLFLAEKRTLAGLSIFYPAPGSQDFDTCQQANLLPETFQCMRSSALPLDNTTSRLQAATLLRLSRILNYMKHLMDTENRIPPALAYDLSVRCLPPDRPAASKQLLQWFLHDGIIRGAEPDGSVFSHHIDTRISVQFSRQIQTVPLAGTR